MKAVMLVYAHLEMRAGIVASKGWAIELLGEEAALRRLAGSLPDHHNPHIEVYTDEGGEHFLLRDPEFDRLADASAIRAEAMLSVSVLVGAWAAKNRVLAAVTTGSVFEFDQNGQLVSRHTIAVGFGGVMAGFTGTVTIETSGSGGAPPSAAPPQASPVQQLHALAKQHEPIRVLLRSTGQATDWVEIYKVYESAWAVARLLGPGNLNSHLGAEAGRVGYMRWSSHHVRHIKVDEPCPEGFGPGPMSLQEARPLALWLSDHMLDLARQHLAPPI